MKLLDYQYIYLMRKRGSQKHKIGISHYPKKRWKTVNRALNGKVDLLMYRRVFFARGIEKYLHFTFRASRFFLKDAGKGAGHTEWFKFNILERWMTRFWIELFWAAPLILLASTVVIVLYLQGNWYTIDWSWWDQIS